MNPYIQRKRTLFRQKRQSQNDMNQLPNFLFPRNRSSNLFPRLSTNRTYRCSPIPKKKPSTKDGKRLFDIVDIRRRTRQNPILHHKRSKTLHYLDPADKTKRYQNPSNIGKKKREPSSRHSAIERLDKSNKDCLEALETPEFRLRRNKGRDLTEQRVKNIPLIKRALLPEFEQVQKEEAEWQSEESYITPQVRRALLPEFEQVQKEEEAQWDFEEAYTIPRVKRALLPEFEQVGREVYKHGYNDTTFYLLKREEEKEQASQEVSERRKANRMAMNLLKNPLTRLAYSKLHSLRM